MVKHLILFNLAGTKLPRVAFRTTVKSNAFVSTHPEQELLQTLFVINAFFHRTIDCTMDNDEDEGGDGGGDRPNGPLIAVN